MWRSLHDAIYYYYFSNVHWIEKDEIFYFLKSLNVHFT